MCNCKNTNGFKEKLAEANQLNIQTGEPHAVFVMKAVGAVFCCKEDNLTDELGICCYFLADGSEVAYIKKNINQIIVTDAKIETPKLDTKKGSAKKTTETLS